MSMEPSPVSNPAPRPSRRADVVLVSQFFRPETGAGARRATALAEALRERYHIEVLTLEPGYPQSVRYERADWEPEDLASPFPICRRRAFRAHDTSLLRRALREVGMSLSLVSGLLARRPRIVIVSTPSMFLAPLAWLAARLLGAHFIWDLRDLTWRYAKESAPTSSRLRPMLDLLERFMVGLLRRADLVISATAGLTDVVREQGVLDARLMTVTNGVSKPFLDQFAGTIAAPGHARPRVTYVGLMGYNHGIGILVDVARALPEVDFLLVGDGPERPAIEARMLAEGCTNVSMRGYVTHSEELAQLYRDSDVLVNHTRGTPTLDRIVYPAKTFEYFATRRPVVYAGTGYAADLFREQQLAVVVPPDDAAAFAAGIRATLADVPAALGRSRRAREFVETRYCREDLMGGLANEVVRRFGGAKPAPGSGPRVAVVTTVHRWGDPRVFERETATWLEWGCEVHVFVPLTGTIAPRGWSEHPALHVHALPEPTGRAERMRLSLGLGGRVRREGWFDIVHFHDPELIPAMALLALRWPRTYFLYDIHEDLPLEVHSKEWIPAVLRPAVSVAVSAAWTGAAMLFEGFAPATEAIARRWPAARTRIVHNYPKSVFETPADEPGTIDPDRLLFVGALSEVRGIRAMLDAVRTVHARHPQVHLDLVGPIKDGALDAMVAAASAEGWCRHTAWLPPEQLAGFCRGAGIGLVPYLPIPDHLEALPTKIFEYMAMGIPILASDFPLWRDLVERSGCGRVATPSAAALAEAIEGLRADPEALARCAERGRESYRNGYRWESEQAQLRWHLERAMSGAKP